MRTLRGLLFVTLFLPVVLSRVAVAQVINPSSCYSELLQKTEIYQNNESLKLAMLSIVDSEVFEKINTNGSVTALFKGIPFTGGFDAFRVAQRKYFELHKLNLDHESSTFTSVVGLDPQASKIFDSCISGLLQSSYGLSAYTSTEDEASATVQLHWKPTKAGEALKITDSTIVNAIVEGGENYKGKLFPAAVSMKDSKTRILRRINPNKPIIISVDTEPDVAMAKMVIKSVPPMYRCEIKMFDRDPETGAQFISSEVTVADEHAIPGREGRNGQLFIITKQVDGIVSSIQCDRFNQDFIAWEDTNNSISGGSGQNTNTAQCIGSKNGARRSIRMTVTWQKAYTECTAVPWSFPQSAPQEVPTTQHDIVTMSVQ
jgi:hypothetical protein